MARFNEILAGRFNRALQKLTAIKGGPPAAQLATEIATNFQFNQMGADFRYLEGWNRYNVGIVVAANAANISQVRATNDVNTNVIAILEKVAVSVSIAQELDIAQLNFAALVSGHVPILTGAATFQMDSRQGGVQSPSAQAVLQISFANVTNTLANVVGRIQLQALINQDLILFEDQEMPLLPQTNWQIQCTVANTAMLVWLQWRERFLEDSERT